MEIKILGYLTVLEELFFSTTFITHRFAFFFSLLCRKYFSDCIACAPTLFLEYVPASQLSPPNSKNLF